MLLNEFCLEFAKHIVSNKITSRLMLICTSNIFSSLQYLPNCLVSTVDLPQWKKVITQTQARFLVGLCAIHAHESDVHM